MLRPTPKDYFEAEQILLGRSLLYERHPAFQTVDPKQRRGQRYPRIEAALIDILLAYDNEGWRVRLWGGVPVEESRIQDRFRHIRKHTDPALFEHACEEEAKSRETFQQLMPSPESSPFYEIERKIGILQQSPEEGFLALMEDAFLQFSEMKRMYPGFRDIDWRGENKGDFYKIYEGLGIAPKAEGIAQAFNGVSV